MSMEFPNTVPIAWQILLEQAFVRCADAGFGRIETTDGGSRFEAYPGQETAAVDFVEHALLPDGGDS